MKLYLFLLINAFLLSRTTHEGKVIDAEKVDPCIKEYRSNKHGVTLYYPSRWSTPYEFSVNNIGVDLRGDLNNWDKAGIVVSFQNISINKELFFDMLKAYDSVMQQKITKLSGGKLLVTKLSEDTVALSNRKWLAKKYVMKGVVEKEQINTKNTDYIWYSPEKQIFINVKIENDINKNIEKDIDCILSKIRFDD